MNTLPIAQKIQAKYLRAVNNEMIGNYQHSIVVHIMRRIVKLIFETPDFAIDLPIEPRWRDYYTTALQISAYLSYVQYEIIADDTIAHISLTDRYRAQILAAATPPTDTAPTPALTPSECSESASSATDYATPTPECSECSAPPIAAANFRLKAVTTASLEGSLCISRGQGRRQRPQPSDSQQQRIKSAKTQPCPHKPRPSPVSSSAPPTALPPPQPAHPPPHRLSAALS